MPKAVSKIRYALLENTNETGTRYPELRFKINPDQNWESQKGKRGNGCILVVNNSMILGKVWVSHRARESGNDNSVGAILGTEVRMDVMNSARLLMIRLLSGLTPINITLFDNHLVHTLYWSNDFDILLLT